MRNLTIFILAAVWVTCLHTQVLEDDREWKRETETSPRAIDFSQMFEDEKSEMDKFEELKTKRENELRQKMMEAAVLEKAIDPKTYVVGPGDIFTFNIWGALEIQQPIAITPEGLLPVPSVGEINVKELTLSELKENVLEKAKPFYEQSNISITLTTLRSFRVHVVGEVEYPGTYLANPTERISDMITEAGGTTDWANKTGIELRQLNGDTLNFNFSNFESKGDIESDYFVHGGDVVFVPPIDLTSEKVFVEGDFKVGGLYQILENETVHAFLLRVNAFNKNTNPLDVALLRKTDTDIQMIKPYFEGNPDEEVLKNGDHLLVPSAYVYVKGCVQFPGTYPFVSSYTAKDYAGMAGGNLYSGNIKRVKVYNASSGKTKKGPNAPVSPGDTVDMPKSWNEELRNWGPILSAIASSVLAAKAIGLIGN